MKSGYGLNIPEGLIEVCDPTRTAVLIYDMQAGITGQIATGRPIIEGCQVLLEAVRAAGFRVFYTKHISLPNASSGISQLRRAMIWQRKQDPAQTKSVFLPTASAAQIVSELAPLENEVVIEKITMSAFEGTYLNIALRDLGMSAFVVVGIALEIGIEPTVRHALDLGYIPIVIADLCGSRTDELHANSLRTLSDTGEVIVTTSSEWLSAVAQYRLRHGQAQAERAARLRTV